MPMIHSSGTAPNARPHDTGLDNVIRFLRCLEAERFFGTVELRYQSGGIAQILQHSSFKAHELTAQPGSRSIHEHSNQ